MNDMLLSLGLVDAWRPILTALILPPVPFVLATLLGARMLAGRRLAGWLLVLLGCAGVWLGCTQAAGQALQQWLMPPVRALAPSEVADLKRAPRTAIVILGSGRDELAPEYGTADLSPASHERLRYGLWLARETGLPVLFSGGVGHGAPSGPSEAEIAARVAERDYGRTLRWQENRSRDTRENALRSVSMLREQGIQHIVLVTHGVHMARAKLNFERASGADTPLRITPAPMAMAMITPSRLNALQFLPSRSGFTKTNLVLHEWLGRVIGA